MADIIALENKLQMSKARQAALIRKRKILAVQKIFHCSQCPYKCEKCGTQITPIKGDVADDESEQSSQQQVPYRFCATCSAEYMDYIERLQGKGDADCYWHNHLWIETWNKWVDYQRVLNQYLKSKEFNQLMDDLKENISNE